MKPEDLRVMLTGLRDSRSAAVQGIHLNWRGEPPMNPRFSHIHTTRVAA